MHRRQAERGMWFAAGVVCLLAACAAATDFAVDGYGSYKANVAYRVDGGGNRLSSSSVTVAGCAVQSGTADNVIDYSPNGVQLYNLSNPTNTATFRITLDQSYRLNQIRTEYLNFFSGLTLYNYELRLSTNAVDWTTVVAKTNIPSSIALNTFTATDARYIEYQVWGASGNNYILLSEIMAFAAASGPAPQQEGGYNIGPLARIDSESGWISWGPASSMLDNWMTTDGAVPSPTGTVVLALANACFVHALHTGFYAGWDWAKFEISSNKTNWTTIVDGPLAWVNTFNFPAARTKYVRVQGYAGAANGHLRELSVFAQPPPPGTVIIQR